MKLIFAIVNDEDAYSLMDTLNENGFSVTKLASTGGFLRSGNTTIIAGVDDSRVEEVTNIIKETCKSRKQIAQVNSPSTGEGFIPYPIEVHVGGATVFVIDVEQFIKA